MVFANKRSDMTREQWTEVDRFTAERLIPPDAALTAALEANVAAGLPAIDVTPNQGQLLALLARIQGARSILELGTLGGYSTIWLARTLPPGGRLVTLESEPRHAEVAAANIERAGLSSVVDLRVGPALETLPSLLEEGLAPFDLIFIDADKKTYPAYFGWALELSRPGTLIVADNVVRNGGVADLENTDANIVGARRLHELVGAEPRVTATTIQTVGSKGYDGFMLILVTA
jgi:predicted O-methyltransferase YrrM